jgi:hypothetical protein
MSTPSTLLLCAGAAASLAGVWTLAGLSERSPTRSTPRVLAAAAIGLLGEAIVYGRSAADLRAELALPLLFGLAGVLALAVGAGKLEAARADKDGPRVVRRSAGIVMGTFFGMGAVGAASLDLGSGSLAQARLGWALMFALVASTLVVFADRARYAGMGVLALGKRSLVLGLVGAGLPLGARLTAAAQLVRAESSVPERPTSATSAQTNVPVAPAPPSEVSAAVASAAPEAGAAVAASAAPQASGAVPPSEAPVASTTASATAPVAAGEPGSLQVDAVTARGMLEADVRGGVLRRMDKLQACLREPANQQKGTLSLKIGVEPSGSVTYSRATAGELSDTPLGKCLLAVFYKMGFAATSANSANFEITLRVP